MKGLGCVKEKQMPRIFPLCVFFPSQFQVCKCITLVSRPCVCDCNGIGQVASCLYRRNGEEAVAVNDLVDESLVPVPLPDFFPDTFVGYVVKSFSRFCFSEKKKTNKQGFTNKKSLHNSL